MHSRSARAALALLVVATLAAGCSSSDDGGGGDGAGTTSTTAPRPGSEEPGEEAVSVDDGIRIEVLSSQPDRATGPDARIRVVPEAGGDPADLVVTLDGRDVTASLVATDGALEGVVVGLVEGNNTVRAHSRAEPETEAVQRIRSWPLTGPMISGPQRPLLACSTAEHGLGEPTDDDCSAPTRVSWSYVDAAGAVVPLPTPEDRPADLAEVTVDGPDGEKTVPFILRRETGVLNRSVYDIVTVDPSPGGSDTDHGDAAWNGRLIYRFGGGCASTHGQGTALSVVEDVRLLSAGYAIATATFNTGAVQCNDVVSAETVMMVKERFVEVFGLPDHTIGEGASGGAIQIHLIAQNYPGLLDGAVVRESFPDFVTTMAGATDCGLLERWYSTPAGAALTPEQRAAVNGHATEATCRRWNELFGGLLDPSAGCDEAIDPGLVYDAATNPGGVRCTYQDEAVNVFGRDPATGHARRPLDNVGVQYGLEAYNEGAITFEQFVALNRDIGGYDADGAHRLERHEADPEAVALAYETGRVSTGSGDQRKIPIIAVDVWNDPAGDIHDHLRPFSLRDRLTQGRSPATVPGFQIWTRPGADTAGAPGDTPDQQSAEAFHEALGALDEWLSNLDGDAGSGVREEVLERNRPDDALDNCSVPGAAGTTSGVHVYDEESACTEAYPVSGAPRIVAGAPRADDVIKCSLKAVDPADYERPLTERQYQDLLELFPTGVCDWQSPGVGQTAPSMSDRTYEDVTTPEQLA